MLELIGPNEVFYITSDEDAIYDEIDLYTNAITYLGYLVAITDDSDPILEDIEQLTKTYTEYIEELNIELINMEAESQENLPPVLGDDIIDSDVELDDSGKPSHLTIHINL